MPFAKMALPWQAVVLLLQCALFINSSPTERNLSDLNEYYRPQIWSVLDHLNSNPQRGYNYNFGYFVNAQKKTDGVVDIEIEVEAECVNPAECSTKILTCRGYVEYFPDSNKFEALPGVDCRSKAQFNENRRNSVPQAYAEDSSEEVQEMIIRPKKTGCAGCVTELNKNATGVDSLLKLALQHINSEKDRIHKIVNVISVQSQVVAGVRFFVLIEVAPTLCPNSLDVVNPESCPIDQQVPPETCRIQIFQKPTISNDEHIVANNCTTSQEFVPKFPNKNGRNDLDNEIDINNYYKRRCGKQPCKDTQTNGPNFDKIAESGNLEDFGLTQERLAAVEAQIIPTDTSNLKHEHVIETTKSVIDNSQLGVEDIPSVQTSTDYVHHANDMQEQVTELESLASANANDDQQQQEYQQGLLITPHFAEIRKRQAPNTSDESKSSSEEVKVPDTAAPRTTRQAQKQSSEESEESDEVKSTVATETRHKREIAVEETGIAPVKSTHQTSSQSSEESNESDENKNAKLQVPSAPITRQKRDVNNDDASSSSSSSEENNGDESVGNKNIDKGDKNLGNENNDNDTDDYNNDDDHNSRKTKEKKPSTNNDDDIDDYDNAQYKNKYKKKARHSDGNEDKKVLLKKKVSEKANDDNAGSSLSSSPDDHDKDQIRDRRATNDDSSSSSSSSDDDDNDNDKKSKVIQKSDKGNKDNKNNDDSSSSSSDDDDNNNNIKATKKDDSSSSSSSSSDDDDNNNDNGNNQKTSKQKSQKNKKDDKDDNNDTSSSSSSEDDDDDNDNGNKHKNSNQKNQKNKKNDNKDDNNDTSSSSSSDDDDDDNNKNDNGHKKSNQKNKKNDKDDNNDSSSSSSSSDDDDNNKNRRKRELKDFEKPKSDEKLLVKKIANYAVTSFDDSTHKHDLLEILRVKKIELEGAVYHLTIRISSSKCSDVNKCVPDEEKLCKVQMHVAKDQRIKMLKSHCLSTDTASDKNRTDKRSKRQIRGGVNNADHDDVIKELAKSTLLQLDNESPHQTKYKIVDILEATKQVVSGMLYKMKVKMVPSDCPKNDARDSETCNELKDADPQVCTIKIWDQPWLPNGRKTDVICESKTYTFRSKRSLRNYQLLGQDDHHIHFGLFRKFMEEHKRVYRNPEEVKVRFRIFRENMKTAEELNKNELGSAIYGITKFADMTREEYKEYLGYRPDLRNENDIKFAHAEIPNLELPNSFDWRSKGVVTEVKNQQQCGSCWAFSVTGNIEGQYAMKYHKLLEFSEQELVDCDTVDEGCNGGLMDNAYRAIERMGGLESETDYPYDAKDEKCHFNPSLAKVQLKGAVNISHDETDMAKWLVQNGPISIAINANAMQFYMGGVSHPLKMLCNPNELDHGVLIVGYGVHKYPLFHKSLPYWIVKNSWGTTWGEQGYYRVFRGDGTCGLNQTPSSAIVL